MNKKGTASDVVFAGVLVFMVATGVFIIGFIGDTVTDRMTNTTAINESSEAVAAMTGANNAINNNIDYVVFGLFIGLVLAIIVTSWFIGANPLFFFVYFIIIVLGVVISAILSNTWESITEHATMTAYLTNLPITNHLLTYLPFYVSGIGILGLIIMFAKPYSISGGGI